jgi:exoribonuclease R
VTRRLRLAPPAGELAAGFAAIRAELRIPDAFPPEVEAEAAAASAPSSDPLDLPLVTIDPPGSRDLDQSYYAERDGRGYRLTYAISDAGAFVTPGGALDAESRRRGMTLYAPDTRTLLYPPSLSEGRASQLPGQDVPAVVWTFDLDADGEPQQVRVERATVRSRAQLDYASVQRDLDAGTAPEPLVLLREIGMLRLDREAERGGISLPNLSQEVVKDGDEYALAYVAPLPVENWNAQVSLLTGMAAAKVMLDGGVGLLRTMPPPDPGSVAQLKRSAEALHVEWCEPYPRFIRSLDPANPKHAALLTLSTTLLRGAGYTAFDGAPPPDHEHSAIAAPYAHATAPLRRLADRFVNETVLALHDGRDVPAWCREALPTLPERMAEADHRSREYERAILDYVEAMTLRTHVGEAFDAVATSKDTVQVADPAVRARVTTDVRPGDRLRVKLVEADPASRRVRFAPC